MATDLPVPLCPCGKPSRNQKRGGWCHDCWRFARYAGAGRKERALAGMDPAQRARVERLITGELTDEAIEEIYSNH